VGISSPEQNQFSTADYDTAPIDGTDLRNFASQIAGRVIAVDGPDYEAARLVFNRAFDQRPALIVRCANPQDVVKALEFAHAAVFPWRCAAVVIAALDSACATAEW